MTSAKDTKPTPSLDQLCFVHDDRFIEPFSNRTHTVLGKRLLPFSLWTQCNLEWAQSPFLLGNRIPTVHDLWVAVQCASTPWTPEHLSPNIAVPPLKSWAGLKWMLNIRRYSYPMELAKFQAYMEDFCTGPRFWSNHHKTNGGSVERVPDVDDNLETAVYAEHEFKWPPHIAWTMPLGQLRWRLALVNRFKGGESRFWSPMDEARAVARRAEREAQLDLAAESLRKADPSLTPEAAHRKAHAEYWAKIQSNIDQADQRIPSPPRGEPV